MQRWGILFVRRVPDLRDIYTSDRISMSPKTKFIATASAENQSTNVLKITDGNKTSEDGHTSYPLVQPDKLANDHSPTLSQVVELYLLISYNLKSHEI